MEGLRHAWRSQFNMRIDRNKFYSVAQVAEMAGKSRLAVSEWLRRRAKKGEIIGETAGTTRIIRGDTVEQILPRIKHASPGKRD